MDNAQTHTELEQEIANYLATGESDAVGRCGPGNLIEAMTTYDRQLRDALLAEVQRREAGCTQQALPAGLDLTSFTRRKVEPMINGLFPAVERDIVLGVAERSIVFLTREVAHELIREMAFRESAWTIANIYLGSLGLDPLDGGSERILGCNEHMTCYVSLEYFRETDPFADYVVHEVAHIFHNCKRETIGLPHTRRKEWLLDIAYAKRETFAYACEAYSRILEQAQKPSDRQELLAQYAKDVGTSDDRVDHEELVEILAEAVQARNGWKRILARCANPKRIRSSRPYLNPSS